MTTLAVVGGIGLLLTLAGAVTKGFGGALIFLGLTLLVLGLGALLFGRRAWALITSRKTGAGLLAAGLVTVIIGASLVSPAVSDTVTPTPEADPAAIKSSAQLEADQQAAAAASSSAGAAQAARLAAAASSSSAAAAAQAEADRQAAASASSAAAAASSSSAAAAAQAQADQQAAAAAAAAQAEADQQAAAAAAAAQAEADQQAQQAPAPAPAPQIAGTVHPGAFCSPAGALGVTTDGTPMVCRTSATDSRDRWRSAG